MSVRLYVGNLPYQTTQDQLREIFAYYGEVAEATIILDRETGRSKGFGFVQMTDGGENALDALDGNNIGGRTIRVRKAEPRRQPAGNHAPRRDRGYGGHRQDRW